MIQLQRPTFVEIKHTPTPWRLQSGFLTIYATSNPENGTGITNAIASVDDCRHSSGSIVTPAEAKANGEFIILATSAHDTMLNTCKDLRERLRAHLQGNTSPIKIVIDDMIIQLNIAINKGGG